MKDRRRPRRRFGWANAHAVADQHAFEVLSIYAQAHSNAARAAAEQRSK